MDLAEQIFKQVDSIIRQKIKFEVPKKNIEIEFHVLVYEKNNIGSIFDVNLVVPDSMQKSRILYYVNKYFKIRKQYRYI